jgi:two-component system CheB/CheR fusion protein
MLILVTGLMAASAAVLLGLVWITHEDTLARGGQERAAETLELAALLARDRFEDLSDRRQDSITEQNTALRQTLGALLGTLEAIQKSSGPEHAGKAKDAAAAAITAAGVGSGLHFFAFDSRLDAVAFSGAPSPGGNWGGIKTPGGAPALESAKLTIDRDGHDTLLIRWPGASYGAPGTRLAHIERFAPLEWYVGVSVDYGRLESRAIREKNHVVQDVLSSLAHMTIGGTGRLFVLNARAPAILLSPPGAERAFLEAHGQEIANAASESSDPVRFRPRAPGGALTAFAMDMPDLGWTLGITMETAELEAQAVILAKRQLVAMGAVFLGGLALALVFTRRITDPLAELSKSAARLDPMAGAGPVMIGELEALARGNPGEVGDLAEAWKQTLIALDEGMARLTSASRAREEAASQLMESKAELERLNRELEERVELRTKALSAANERLRQSESRYRGLFTSSPVPFLECDFSALAACLEPAQVKSAMDLESLLERSPTMAADCLSLIRIIDANQAAVEAAGAADKAELAASAPLMLTAGNVLSLRDAFAAFRSGSPVHTRESAFRTLSGQTRQCIASLSPLPGREAALDHVVVSILDITDQKRVEERLRAAHEQSMAASRSKNEFLANMSHEIRTPINAILGLAELSLRQSDPAKTGLHLGMIADSARALLGIIGDVLDLSRVEAGRLALNVKPFELMRAVARAVDPFRTACQEKGLSLTVSPQEGLPGKLLGDPIRLTQIVSNLVGNAVKFTRTGGVSVSIKESWRGQDGVRLAFTVTDTGIGIPPELTRSIFESFRQADSSASKNYQGAGLGLAICRELAALMDGRIWVQSEPGKGSSFHFTAHFGLVREERAFSEEPAPLVPTGQGVRVLVAEDNPVNRHVFMECLSSLGHEVVTAQDGQEALDILKSQRFALIFMDIQMPRVDGVSAVVRIRAGECGEEAAKTPVVALTAYAMRGDEERFLRSGMTGYLAKPVSLDALQAAVQKYAAPGAPAPAPAPGRASAAARESHAHLMDEFIEYIGERARTALDCLQSGRMDEAAKAGHDIKGTSMSFGLGQVNRLGLELEKAARAGDADAAALAAREVLKSLEEMGG